MTARLFRAHTRLPPAHLCPRRQQRRLVRHRSERKHARLLLSLDYCFPSLCHKRGSCRFHYPYTNLAYVDDDAESGSGKHLSPLARTRGSNTPENTPASPKPFPIDITTPWTTLVPACLKTSPPKTRSGASLLGWPQTGTSPHKRPIISCSATVSSTHDTLHDTPPEITTRLTTMTLYSKHPSPRPTCSDPLKMSNLLSLVWPGLAKSYLINAILQLFTDRAAASTLKVTAPTRIPRQHPPRCGSVADIQFIQ